MNDSAFDSLVTVTEAVLAESGTEPDLSQLILRALLDSEAGEREDGSISLFPLLMCESHQGHYLQAVPAAAAWRLSHMAAKVFDDVEDGDAVRLDASPCIPKLVNLGTALYATAMLCLHKLPERVRRDLTYSFSLAILKMTRGQHVEFSGKEGLDVETYIGTAGLKSGEFYALGAEVGTRCATYNPECLDSARRVGYNLGVMIQLADDLDGLHCEGLSGDLAQGRRKLPLVHALNTPSRAQRSKVEELARLAGRDPEAESQLRSLIIDAGGDLYAAIEIERYRERALESLDSDLHDEASASRLRSFLETVCTDGTARG